MRPSVCIVCLCGHVYVVCVCARVCVCVYVIDLHWIRALTVPMHLCHMALCAQQSDISSGEPCPFTKVPDGPQI